MNPGSKAAVPAFLNSYADLDLLEKQIQAALKRTWILLGLLLGTGLMVGAYLVGKQLFL